VAAGLAYGYRLYARFVCDVQRRCSCSCRLWCYRSVMPLRFTFYAWLQARRRHRGLVAAVRVPCRRQSRSYRLPRLSPVVARHSTASTRPIAVVGFPTNGTTRCPKEAQLVLTIVPPPLGCLNRTRLEVRSVRSGIRCPPVSGPLTTARKRTTSARSALVLMTTTIRVHNRQPGVKLHAIRAIKNERLGSSDETGCF